MVEDIFGSLNEICADIDSITANVGSIGASRIDEEVS